MKKIKIKSRAFTLVELIIVITILAILATIAFVSFQSYTKSARDSNKVSSLRSIQQWLMSYQVKTWNYPDPDNMLDIVWVNYQWNIGQNISKLIKIWPTSLWNSSDNIYLYSISRNKIKYELWVYLEEKNNMYFTMIPFTYAVNSDYLKQYLYTIWDLVWMVIDPKTNAPAQEIYTGSLNLTTNTWTFIVQFSNTASNSGIVTWSGSAFVTQIQTIQSSSWTVTWWWWGWWTTNYTVSGNVTSGSGATIWVCGMSTTADTTWFFSLSVSSGTNCNNLTISRTNYTCSVSTNGPTALSGNVSNLAGSCTLVVNWTCGSANWVATTSYPTANWCTSGTKADVDTVGSDGTYNWSCNGSGWGTSVSCSASKQQTYACKCEHTLWSWTFDQMSLENKSTCTGYSSWSDTNDNIAMSCASNISWQVCASDAAYPCWTNACANVNWTCTSN